MTSGNDTCTGVFGDTTGMEPLCWRCAPPRYVFDVKFAGAFFSLLWNNAFLVALGQLIVAGACAQWFFTLQERRGKEPVIRQSVRMAFRYHLGSVAFGAFILALVQFIRQALKRARVLEAQRIDAEVCHFGPFRVESGISLS